MHTKEDLLKLAGKLAIAAREVVNSNALNLSDKIKLMERALLEYNSAIIDNINYRE